MRLFDYPALTKLGGSPTEAEKSYYFELCDRHGLDPHAINVDNRDLVKSVLIAYGWEKDGSSEEMRNSGWRRYYIIKRDFIDGEDPEVSAHKLGVNPKIVEFYRAFHQEAAYEKWQEYDFSIDPEDAQFAAEVRALEEASYMNI